jgi:hypothetical protein
MKRRKQVRSAVARVYIFMKPGTRDRVQFVTRRLLSLMVRDPFRTVPSWNTACPLRGCMHSRVTGRLSVKVLVLGGSRAIMNRY